MNPFSCNCEQLIKKCNKCFLYITPFSSVGRCLLLSRVAIILPPIYPVSPPIRTISMQTMMQINTAKCQSFTAYSVSIMIYVMICRVLYLSVGLWVSEYIIHTPQFSQNCSKTERVT